MIRARRIRVLVAAFALVTIAATAGCTPSAPTPSPTPSGFADEAEAFAAAEETYRAYVDALNRVDLSDPATFEDVYRWTTGDAYAGERESLSTMHANGWTVTGETVVERFVGSEFLSRDATIRAYVCSNVSGVTVMDASGEPQTAADRPPVFELEVIFVGADEPRTGLLISRSQAVEISRCG
ncbi:hypothetical protein [Microbacterium caowuchunii]|uniref:Nuclear transport factor 2 family protein n=1 Tax=Microbacterium caowuchunii TaxID=2614638 RepID=A0A5N0TLA5_9MICO|nr:hypothetical protein [Microbacterium caowuchunii]KAA9135880.1 hypothetical protein F6B40_01480 [Microbacterium caowuchunii]